MSGAAYVLILRLPIVVGVEVSVGDGVDINMLWWLDGRSDEVGVVVFGVSGEQEE